MLGRCLLYASAFFMLAGLIRRFLGRFFCKGRDGFLGWFPVLGNRNEVGAGVGLPGLPM